MGTFFGTHCWNPFIILESMTICCYGVMTNKHNSCIWHMLKYSWNFVLKICNLKDYPLWQSVLSLSPHMSILSTLLLLTLFNCYMFVLDLWACWQSQTLLEFFKWITKVQPWKWKNLRNTNFQLGEVSKIEFRIVNTSIRIGSVAMFL